MENSNSKISKIIDGLSMFAGKLSAQKHIMAIRDAFVITIPIIIVSAFFLLINNVLLQPETGLLRSIPNSAKLLEIGNQVYNGTLGVMAILIAFSAGYSLAKAYGEDGILEAIISVCTYMILIPPQLMVTSITGESFEAGSVLTQAVTSSSGLFLALIASLTSVTLICKINKYEKIKIKMPDSVPPAIAKSFNTLVPAFIVLTIFAIIEFLTVLVTGESIPDIIVKVLQTPLVGGFQTLPGILLYVFLAGFVWVFGIYGAFVFGAISGPVLLTSLQQNIDALKAGEVLPNIVTQPFLDAYVYMGGGGTMICLVIAIFIASKRADYRMVTKLGLVPCLFNVSEPLMFGLPVIFNPILGIPLVITPLVSTTIAYFATKFGLVSYTSIVMPWVTPPVLSGYLATNGDIRASILQIVIIAVGVLIYLPFVLASNKAAKLEKSNLA